jgi:NAD(P)-dependent dehydrogenase (short-subunit alcohol dehydrogenase family)
MVEDLFKTYPERRTEWPKQNMLGRLSKPQEYRGAAAFLISDASSFMTGKSSCYLPASWRLSTNSMGLGSDLRMDGGHAAW